MLKRINDDLNTLRIDPLSILIYYPAIKLIYWASLRSKIITPNFVTIFGFAQFITLTTASLFTGDLFYLTAGLILFALMDVTDGYIARKRKMASNLGAILDLTVDRIVFSILIASSSFLFYREGLISELSMSFLYGFLFIFLDTVHLIGDQAKKIFKITENSASKVKSPWWKNEEFRFTSYIFFAIWLSSNSMELYAVAILFVTLDYISYLKKSVVKLRLK